MRPPIADLRAHLVATRIAGDVDTPREDNLVNVGRMAQGREKLLATGHPTGVLALHLLVAGALRAAGCTVLVPELDWDWPHETEGGGQPAWGSVPNG